ncbi:MAG: hypothetical protein ACOC2E_03845 [Bacteroidota bacterium]
MNKKEERPSKISYERYLNELGIPESFKKSNNGHIPDYVKYGTWLRVNDTDKFENDYQDWKAKVRAEQNLS